MYLEVTSPLGALGLAKNSLPPGTNIEFERTATVLGRCTPSFRITGPGTDSVIAALRDSPFVSEKSVFSENQAGSVYRFTWSDTRPELIEQIRETDGSFLSAIAEGDTWTFELRFPNQTAATHFYTYYTDSDHPITVQKTRQDEPVNPTLGDSLTAEQRDALDRAVDSGYFQVPRQTTLVQLADEMGISDSAVSQRLRRGLQNILLDGTSPPKTMSRSEHDELR